MAFSGLARGRTTRSPANRSQKTAKSGGGGTPSYYNVFDSSPSVSARDLQNRDRNKRFMFSVKRKDVTSVQQHLEVQPVGIRSHKCHDFYQILDMFIPRTCNCAPHDTKRCATDIHMTYLHIFYTINTLSLPVNRRAPGFVQLHV